jgi:hypothetical protein
VPFTRNNVQRLKILKEIVVTLCVFEISREWFFVPISKTSFKIIESIASNTFMSILKEKKSEINLFQQQELTSSNEK